MKAHQIWKKGWLVKKPYCYNPAHPHYNPTIDKIIRDLNKGQNRIILVVGTPRSGKSWFSIWLMCYLNYNYYGKVTKLEDLYWQLDGFLKATKDPSNREKFICMEEQGVEQYAKDWYRTDVQGFDKITQIFGVDETNIILNLPYIFDLNKGTRLKAHYLIRTLRKTKQKINIVLHHKRMTLTTEKAYYTPVITWQDVPNVYEIPNKNLKDKFVKVIKDYEKKKREYNIEKKDQIIKDIQPKSKKSRDSGLLKAKPMFQLKR